MTRGLLDAKIRVLAGIDNDPACEETYLRNNSPAQFILEDVQALDPEQFESGYATRQKKVIKIAKDDDNMLFVGCSPCQYWSGMKTDKTKSEDSRNLLTDFKKFVDYFRPGYVVIENVPGILHRRESPLADFLQFLDAHGYFSVDKGLIKAWEYGVPQTRKRFLLIASRVKSVALPRPTIGAPNRVRDFIGDLSVFPEIPAGRRDPTDFCHTTADLSEVNRRRLALTPADGGTRESWASTELQLPVYKRHSEDSSFGFQDVYGRMFWDRPAPTITTRFYSISNGRFAHPIQNRPISLREGATLQTFDLDYKFHADSVAAIARLIGNAVPPVLARRIGEAVRTATPRQPDLFTS